MKPLLVFFLFVIVRARLRTNRSVPLVTTLVISFLLLSVSEERILKKLFILHLSRLNIMFYVSVFISSVNLYICFNMYCKALLDIAGNGVI